MIEMHEQLMLFSVRKSTLLAFSDVPEEVFFQRLSHFSVLVCEESKKRVIKLNHIFELHGDFYAFVLASQPLYILQVEKKDQSFFVFLKTELFLFFKSFFCQKYFYFFNIFFKKMMNKKVIMILLFFISIKMLLKNMEINEQTSNVSNHALQLKKEVYAGYEYILKNLTNEPVPVSSKSFEQVRFFSVKREKKRNTANKKTRVEIKKQKNIYKKGNIDPDLEYFLSVSRK